MPHCSGTCALIFKCFSVWKCFQVGRSVLSLNPALCLSTGTAGTRGWAGTCFSHFWSLSCSEEHEAQRPTDWHSGLALLLSECDLGKWPNLSKHNFLIYKIEVIKYLPHWAVVRGRWDAVYLYSVFSTVPGTRKILRNDTCCWLYNFVLLQGLPRWTPVHLASPHFRLSMWARRPKLGFLGLQCFEGVFEFGSGGRRLPALMGSNPRLLSASAPSLTLWHGPLSHSIPNNRLLWQLVPAAEEEWRLCCDRDGQVVETKAEWGVGRCGRCAQLVWIPSQGSGTFSWRQVGSCQEQIDRFRVRLCFLQWSDFRDISSLNLSCLLYEMGGSAGPWSCWESGVRGWLCCVLLVWDRDSWRKVEKLVEAPFSSLFDPQGG